MNARSPSVRAVFRRAAELASAFGNRSISTVFLACALAQEGDEASRILARSGISAADCEEYLHIPPPPYEPAVPALFSAQTSCLVSLAEKYAARMGAPLQTYHLLLALCRNAADEGYRMLRDLGADPVAMQKTLLAFAEAQSVSSPELIRFTVDLTKAARREQYDPVAVREEEIAQAAGILQEEDGCAVLAGPPGVGKTAIIEEIARRVANETLAIPGCRRVVRLDSAAMIAGSARPGEFEKRFSGLLTQIKQMPEVLLVIDDADTLFGLGAPAGALDAAGILRKFLAKASMRLLAATTPAFYRKHFAEDDVFSALRPVFVEEPDTAQTVEILRALRSRYEDYHRVYISDEAIEAAVKMSGAISMRVLPDRAIDLLDEAAAMMHIETPALSEGPEQWEQELQGILKEKAAAVLKEQYETAAKLLEAEEAVRAKLRNWTGCGDEEVRPVVCGESIRIIARARCPDALLPPRQED